MKNNNTLCIIPSGRGFAIAAGKSKLAQFRSQSEAVRYWENNAAFIAYWAGSIGVSVENADKVTVSL